MYISKSLRSMESQPIGANMKLPYISANGLYYHCKRHGYLTPAEFYPSDLKNRRRSCKICSKKRVHVSCCKFKRSRAPRSAELIFDRFKRYAARHGHDEVKLWELDDVRHLFCFDQKFPGDICIRPMDKRARLWDPWQLKTITLEEARKNR